MRFESFAAVPRFEQAVDLAFEDAVADTVDEAQRRAKKVTGRWARSIEAEPIRREGGRRVTFVGSTLRSARAHERGAFIQARTGGKLVFDAGSGVRKVSSVRLSPQPAVEPAGRLYPSLMAARLRQRLG